MCIVALNYIDRVVLYWRESPIVWVVLYHGVRGEADGGEA